jgi:hypothetical protein
MTEWADQERAAHEERLGLDSTNLEPRIAQYRLITRILREPMEDTLPAHFATMVAARADAATQATADRRDRWFHGALFASLALAALGGVSLDLAAALRAIVMHTNSRPSAGIRWAVAIAVCLAVTLVIEIRATEVLSRPRSASGAPRGRR